MNQFPQSNNVILRTGRDLVCVSCWGAFNNYNSAVLSAAYIACLEITYCESGRMESCARLAEMDRNTQSLFGGKSSFSG